MASLPPQRLCWRCLSKGRSPKFIRSRTSANGVRRHISGSTNSRYHERMASTAAAPRSDVRAGEDDALYKGLLRSSKLVILPNPRKGDKFPYSGAQDDSKNLSESAFELSALFEACTASLHFSRAFGLLCKLKEEVSVPLFTAALNRYLEKVADDVKQQQSVERVDQIWHYLRPGGSWQSQGNDLTFAYLCKSALHLDNEHDRIKLVREYVSAFRSEPRNGSIGAILKEVKALGKWGLEQMIEINKVTLNALPKKFRFVFDYLRKGDEHGNLRYEVSPSHPLQAVPEALETQSQGPGLQVLKSSLNALLDPYVELPVEEILSTKLTRQYDNMHIDLARQKLLEVSALDGAAQRWKFEHEQIKQRGDVPSISKKMNGLLWEWHLQLKSLIEAELVKVGHAENVDLNTLKPADKKDAMQRRQYGPYLRVLTPSKLSVTTILEMIRLHGHGGFAEGVKTARALLSIGRAIENEYFSERLQQAESKKLFGGSINLNEVFNNEKLFSKAVRRLRTSASSSENMKSAEIAPPLDWSQVVRAKIGSTLVSLLIHCAKVTQTAKDVHGVEISQRAQAFYHTYQYVRGQRVGVIRYHDNLLSELTLKSFAGAMHPSMLPMLVPPRKWTSWQSGGYLYTDSKVMRMKDAPEQRQYIAAASETGQLDSVFKALDVLGSTAWTVNQKVFQIVLSVWNSGKEFPGIQPLTVEFPESQSTNESELSGFSLAKQRKTEATAIANNQSRRCDLNYKVEIARAFLKEKFYLPHNMDFRGRAYPIASHFHHLGNDLTRGLLLFHEGKELGPSGLRWLKVHLANLCGVDKVSFDDREAWTDSNIDRVFESADKPLQGSRWWTQFDDCWQALATCFEITAALRSRDPTKFRSQLPVHQDGTCNGLQHYAALGGDLEGAIQVNLEPNEKPQDVYSAVAAKVNTLVDRDAQDPSSKNYQRALMLQGKVTRKVVKQTVMTNVYGVTFVGARAQIQSQLVKRGDVPPEKTYELSSYLASYTFQSLRSLFKGAHEIQEWLFNSASRIARSYNPDDPESAKMASVVWTTPLNVPIVQPYRGVSSKDVVTNLQSVHLTDPNVVMPVDSRRQATAFPPNFIHSLDATHMLLSALATKRKGIAFAAVHDSYWSHACDVDSMNEVLRHAFVRLHSEDLMGRLKSEFEERYRGYYYKCKAPPDSKEGRRLLKSRSESKQAAEVTDDDQILYDQETAPRKRRSSDTVRGVLPLKFDDLPARGSFDVRRVRNSKYFFS